MRDTPRRVLFWAPRALAILFALFISIFAFDVFVEGASFWEMLVALIIHLIPTALVVIALAFAWRRDSVGGILFTALGLLYIVVAWGQFEWMAYLLISGPLFLIAVLFLSNWLYRRKL
jgi:hypothetical protein